MYKLAEVELTSHEVKKVQKAIEQMGIEVFVVPTLIGYDLMSEVHGDLMELFDLISFELNLIEEDILEF